MSRTRLAIWFLAGLLAMAGLGLLAGERIAAWRVNRAHDVEVAKLQRGEASDLRVGQELPEVDLVGPDGRRTNTRDVLRDEDALVVFFSLGCDACTEALLVWNSHLEMHVTGQPQIIGIARAAAEDLDIYLRETGITMPVFADEQDVFGSRYSLHAVPTVAGTRAGGMIVFIRHGISEDFTPEAAAELLTHAP